MSATKNASVNVENTERYQEASGTNTGKLLEFQQQPR